MDLLLWRHAEAEDGVPDVKRKLTARGEKQARQMAEWIKKHAPKNLRIIASPAIRCQQTAQALGLPFETDKRLGTDSNALDLLAAAGWPDGGKNANGHTAVLVVGHQPTLGQTAALLLSGKEDNWTVVKGAAWWFANRTRHGKTRTVLSAVLPPNPPERRRSAHSSDKKRHTAAATLCLRPTEKQPLTEKTESGMAIAHSNPNTSRSCV